MCENILIESLSCCISTITAEGESLNKKPEYYI